MLIFILNNTALVKFEYIYIFLTKFIKKTCFHAGEKKNDNNYIGCTLIKIDLLLEHQLKAHKNKVNVQILKGFVITILKCIPNTCKKYVVFFLMS